MQRYYKAISSAALALGGALVGSLLGSICGPVRIDLGVDQVVALGGVLGGVLTLAGCGAALERHEVRARNRMVRRAIEQRLARIGRPAGRMEPGRGGGPSWPGPAPRPGEVALRPSGQPAPLPRRCP